jgi:hypothetical protein
VWKSNRRYELQYRAGRVQNGYGDSLNRRDCACVDVAFGFDFGRSAPRHTIQIN